MLILMSVLFVLLVWLLVLMMMMLMMNVDFDVGVVCVVGAVDVGVDVVVAVVLPLPLSLLSLVLLLLLLLLLLPPLLLLLVVVVVAAAVVVVVPTALVMILMMTVVMCVRLCWGCFLVLLFGGGIWRCHCCVLLLGVVVWCCLFSLVAGCFFWWLWLWWLLWLSGLGPGRAGASFPRILGAVRTTTVHFREPAAWRCGQAFFSFEPHSCSSVRVRAMASMFSISCFVSSCWFQRKPATTGKMQGTSSQDK